MTSVIVKFNFQLIHHYPNASGNTEYLKNPHRHIFYIELKVEVFHNDREIEFIDLKDKLEAYCVIDKLTWSETISCEQTGEKILEYTKSLFVSQRKMSIKVFEDNENGIEIEEE